MSQDYSGRCHCGAVTYTAKGPPVVVAQCHCAACRSLSGTGHSIGAMFRRQAVRVTGPLHTYSYASDHASQVTKASCAVCGSPIYGQNTRAPDHMTLTLGTMEDATGLEVEVVIFARDRPHWDALGPQACFFAGQPDWTPSD